MNEQNTKDECATNFFEAEFRDSESEKPLILNNDLLSMQILNDNFDKQMIDGAKFDEYINQGYIEREFHKNHIQTIKEDDTKENSTEECCLCM